MNRLALPLALLALFSPTLIAQKKKVYISVDMEGIAGVVTNDQLGPGSFEYDRFRQFMTDEALAAVKPPKMPGRPRLW
jgi:D-amino peptidase